MDYTFHWWSRFLKNGNPFHTDSYDQPNRGIPVSNSTIPLNFNVDNANANVATYSQDQAGWHFRIDLDSNSTGEMWFTFRTDKPLNYVYSTTGGLGGNGQRDGQPLFGYLGAALWRGPGRKDTTYTEAARWQEWILGKFRVEKVYDDVIAYRPYGSPSCPGCDLSYYMFRGGDVTGTLPAGTYTLRLDWNPGAVPLNLRAGIRLDLSPQ